MDKDIATLQAEIQARNKQMTDFAKEKGLISQAMGKEEEEPKEKPKDGEKKATGVLV